MLFRMVVLDPLPEKRRAVGESEQGNVSQGVVTVPGSNCERPAEPNLCSRCCRCVDHAGPCWTQHPVLLSLSSSQLSRPFYPLLFIALRRVAVPSRCNFHAPRGSAAEQALSRDSRPLQPLDSSRPSGTYLSYLHSVPPCIA